VTRAGPLVTAFALLLAGCGGVDGEQLFAPSPLTPPGFCPDSEDCGNQPPPAKLQEGPCPISHASKPTTTPEPAETEAPADRETWPPPDSTSPDAGDPEPIEVAHG